ncbi:MAG: hypothetical protein JM58_09545 [Peptococcaceae bacterium BICA1-8]|nr:MAG: hypothetical protein JM58_09545 [Peptococcaceae bacterium BICA1-8]
MFSWTSFLLGLFLATPIALIVFALFKIQPEKCRWCYNDATTIKNIGEVECKLCSECAEYYNQSIEVTE